MDLYSQDIGVAFAHVTGFDAVVGGSPTNIAIGVSRLGLRSVALTAVGDDGVGEFVRRYLEGEGVATDFIPTIQGKLTSLAMIGVQPPDSFPLSFYREDPADIYLTRAHVDKVPFDSVKALQVSGNALSRGPCAEAALYALEVAERHGVATFMDLDLRPSEWASVSAFGTAVSKAIPMVDVVIGTEEEFYAALMPNPERALSGQSLRDDERTELEVAMSRALVSTSQAFVVKRGERGATVSSADGSMDVHGFTVDVINTVGAGDAFASGLIRSRVKGLDWQESVRFANACGAIVVSRHGCSAAFPTRSEVDDFMSQRATR
jgi:5-dehydro-2-deoxygluconokinase